MEILSAKELVAPPFHALVYGDSGTGKTYSLRTLPKPVFVFCADPDGMVTLRGFDGIDFVYLTESPQMTAVSKLEEALETFERDLRGRYASVAFDSLTSFGDILMNHCIRLTGKDPLDMFPSRYKKGEGVLLGPSQQDYGNEMTLIQRFVSKVLTWPINVVFTAHAEIVKDQITGKVIGGPMLTGKLRNKLPNLFTEVYLTKREGTRYVFRTKGDGIYIAKSRLSQEGKLDEIEEPDFSRIISKVGILSDVERKAS